MHKYWMQVFIYTNYFFKVLRDDLGVLVYTIGLPVVFLGLNTSRFIGTPLTTLQFADRVLPFIAWMIFSNVLVAMTSIGQLREQGYLKQYRTLVVNVSVLIVSELLVTVTLLAVTLIIVAAVAAGAFHLAFWQLLWQLGLTLVLVYPPMVGFCLPVLAVAMNTKTLNAVLNVVTLVVMFGSAAINQVMTPSLTNPIINLMSPVYFDLNVFIALTQGQLLRYVGTYLLVLVFWGCVGHWSYRHLVILPKEAA